MDTRKELITFSCSLNIASDLQAYDFLIIKRNIYIYIYIYIYIFFFFLFFFLSEVCFSFDRKIVQGLKMGEMIEIWRRITTKVAWRLCER